MVFGVTAGFAEPRPLATAVARIATTVLTGVVTPTDRWLTALVDAAERWQRVTRGELPEAPLDSAAQRCGWGFPVPPLAGVERGVRIVVGVDRGFEPNTYVEAVGAPCAQRPLPHTTTILGRIALNADKLVEAINSPRLRFVATHEMG